MNWQDSLTHHAMLSKTMLKQLWKCGVANNAMQTISYGMLRLEPSKVEHKLNMFILLFSVHHVCNKLILKVRLLLGKKLTQ